MNKFYTLLFAIVFFASANAKAQCVPDPNNLTLITPDTTTNFVSGTVGQPYSQIVYIHPPEDSMVLIPGGPANPILVSDIEVELISFSGLPPGLTNQCNPSNCIYLGGVSGCTEISGTPTVAGTYPLFAIIGASGTILFGTVSVGPIIDTLLAYRIIINPSGVGINELHTDLSILNISPTVTNQNVEVQYQSVSAAETFITVSNSLGQAVSTQKIRSKSGINSFTINTSALNNGVYIISLQNKTQKITSRFVVAR
ncbi:MAG: T9SS type A sorting domain-containing protein [Bacteroidetes bacterium]|nr:T9SS type A sorting domain-containing protein [Bacteroidota bacterium]HNR20481.1 T9SS type A sorting domain-containing protein [Bacteroidia bacterium]HNU34769.1 T9SS type A sorting domain-containing protein [Bacteroidia bacterium]